MAETLQKFNFPGYQRSRNLSATNRIQVERKFIDLTPLSISCPVQPLKPSDKTFEQRIKDKSFGQKEGKIYNFHQQYREAVAVKEKNPSASHLKKRTSRSNALIRPIIAPELFTRLSGDQKFLPSALHEQEIMPYRSSSERADIAQAVPMPRPNVSEFETPMTAAFSEYIPLTEAQTIPEHFSSPFATIRTDLQLISSSTEPKFLMKPKAILPRPSIPLKSIFEEFRMFSEASDADDERDASGLETETEGEVIGKGVTTQEDDDATNRDQDDGGLHADFKEMTISKKRHISDDDGDEGYQSGDYAGTARNNPENGTAAQSEHQEVKVHSLSTSHIQNVTFEAAADDSMHEIESLSTRNKSDTWKQISAHRLPKRIKSEPIVPQNT